MALKDMFALIDEKLSDVFHTKTAVVGKLRAPVLKAIERTRAQFGQTESPRGPKWFRLANGVVAFTPTLRGGHPLPVNGKTTVFVPSASFLEFLDHMRKAVEAGEFDAQLADPGNGAGVTGKVRMPAERQPRDPNALNKTGWTDERRARFKATMATRRGAVGE